ncbi:hypothetical protein [Deminuibacter soli]|uniref:Outer membrane protein beta-barrel domain-containing protein n=1 Tax=Deminuibacter soli TaxID=2291815 RepID=A0A3E1NDL7_9BACT|nr:hypothetical protein [Deminuibacter soli]RFM26065.1 hypothetical protein DXN05_22345 [Deminuibacter soli]
MFKRIACLLCITFASSQLFAQGITPTYEDGEPAPQEHGFNRNNIFLGGSVSLGFGTGYFNIGGNPEIGYSFSEWLDAGVAFNLSYYSTKYYDYSGYSDANQKSFNYGGGVFARLYPIRNVFLQVQPEYNWSKYTLTDNSSGTQQKSTFRVGAPSLLAGIGYSQRVVGSASFYTVLLFDVNKDPNSPYRNYDGSFIPIIRAGFNVYLHPGRR